MQWHSKPSLHNVHVRISIAWMQVEELRSQIRLLQAVGYNSLGEDDGGEDGAAGASADSSSGGISGGRLVGSLEAMLLQKNRCAMRPEVEFPKNSKDSA